LIVEDSIDDALLLVEQLKNDGFEPTWERVETEADLLAHLEKRPDVVLSDFSMPQFNGLRAAEIVRKSGLDIPFILVSGTVGEELAVEAMKRGATDYLLKDRIARLGTAVRHARDEVRARAERKRMEAEFVAALEEKNRALMAAQEKLLLQATVLATAANAVLITDQAGRITWVNPAFTAMTGYTAEDAIGKTPRLLKSGRHTAEFYRKFWATISSGQTWRGEFINRSKNGSLYYDEHTVTPVRNAEGKITHYVGIQHDVTARKLAEEEMRRAHEQLHQLLAHSPAVLYRLKVDGENVIPMIVSDNMERLLGVAGKDTSFDWWKASLHPDDRERAMAIFADGLKQENYSTEYRIRHLDGSYRWVEDDSRIVRDAAGRPMEIVGVWTDITERRSLEEQLRQAQKMEAVGQLSAGVAHDFNNLLVVINGYSEMLINAGGMSADAVGFLKEIYLAGERAANLTRQLLMFSRKQLMRRHLLDVNETITDVIKMLRRLIGENIKLQTDLGPNLPAVDADPGMIEQALVNLAVNARDAMPDGGCLIITTRNVAVDEKIARQQLSAHAGDFICIAIRDTGCGIAPEIRSRIFEPFFTTKEAGKGTGLGLATVFGIVKQHDGWIDLESAVGVGTTFKLYFPAATRAVGPTQSLAANRATCEGNETILLVEDEEIVRCLAATVLQKFGYSVLEAPSPAEALEIWQQHAGAIDLLLTDMVMPGALNGRDLAEMLRLTKPGLKVIFTSGYHSAMLDNSFASNPGTPFLQKPYMPVELGEAVRTCLDTPKA
jgi:PAS domain S-box-containing protein